MILNDPEGTTHLCLRSFNFDKLLEGRMTYEMLFDLKFREGLSTFELVKRFPHEISRVSEIALLEVPEKTLKQIVKEEKELKRLLRLKRRFSRFL